MSYESPRMFSSSEANHSDDYEDDEEEAEDVDDDSFCLMNISNMDEITTNRIGSLLAPAATAGEEDSLPTSPPQPSQADIAFYGYEEGVGGSSVVHHGNSALLLPESSSTPCTTPLSLSSSPSPAVVVSASSMDLLPFPSSSSSSSTPTGMTMATATYYGGVPGSPLPADRLARKQRNFPRRGGFCHSALLKSAVMACMSEGGDNVMNNRNSSNHSSGSQGGLTASPTDYSGGTMNSPTTTGGGLLVSASSTDLLLWQLQIPNNSLSSSSSPRKRMRRSDAATVSANTSQSSHNSLKSVDGETGSHPQQQQQQQQLKQHQQNQKNQKQQLVDEAVIERATDLLQRLCVRPLDRSDSSSRHMRGTPSNSHRQVANNNIHHPANSTSSTNTTNRCSDADFDRKAPVRRVSRRTSYNSQISTGTDFDDLDDDEFH